jgi:2-succinyl-5-enolpyruvyl-6-hydroxy-3-cyclohexene-1-carboxylate synthase
MTPKPWRGIAGEEPVALIGFRWDAPNIPEKSMSETVSEILVHRLIDWGVDTIFGLPGDGINGVFEGLRRHQDQLKFIQVRHEEAAAFAACGYTKFTGRLGVCIATSGPGGVHLLNGLYDAKCDGQPVLAITGHTYHDLIGTHYQQDVDLDKLFMDVACYNHRIMGPAHTENSSMPPSAPRWPNAVWPTSPSPRTSRNGSFPRTSGPV